MPFKVERTLDSRVRHSVLGRMIDNLDELGLDWLPDVRAAYAWTLTLTAHQPRPADSADTLARLGRDLGTTPGTAADIDAALEEAAAAHRRSDRSGPGAAMLQTALNTATNRAWKLLLAYGEEGLITGLAAPAVAEVVAETTDLAGKVPVGIEDARTAMRAGAKVAAAWSRLTELQDRWERLGTLVDHWRHSSVVPILDEDDDVQHAEYWFRQPEHGARNLAAAIARGADPACLTVAEVTELRAERARRPQPKTEGNVFV